MAGEVRKTIRFTQETWELIDAEMQATGLTMTAIVEFAVKAYLQSAENDDDRYQELVARIEAIEQRLGMSRQ